MNSTKATRHYEIDEEELKTIIEEYVKKVTGVPSKITSLTHVVGEETDISGLDIPYQRGLYLICEDK